MSDLYAAGLIDGEGYIGIQASGGSFQVRLKVTMTDKGMPALLRMERLYGGKIDGPRRGTEVSRDSYSWRLTGAAASALIARLRPHLLVKAESADLALAFQAMVDESPRLPNGRATWTAEMRDRAEVFVRRIQHANRTGPDAPTPQLPDRSPIAVYRWGAWWEPEDDLFGPVEYTGRMPAQGLMVAGHVFAL
jgi:hypothetical protein